MKQLLVDANVVLRFLLGDSTTLSPKAKDIFQKAEDGAHEIYLDEVIVAETVWVLQSFYKLNRKDIAGKLLTLLGQDWIINPRKPLMLSALTAYEHGPLHYIDCWILAVSHRLEIPLATFDHKLKKSA